MLTSDSLPLPLTSVFFRFTLRDTRYFTRIPVIYPYVLSQYALWYMKYS